MSGRTIKDLRVVNDIDIKVSRTLNGTDYHTGCPDGRRGDKAHLFWAALISSTAERDEKAPTWS